MLSGKAIGGGLPLSALTGRAEIMDAPPKSGLGGTFGGNPLSCAASLAAIDVIEKNLGRVEEMNGRIGRRLLEMAERYEVIGDVRGIGLMMAVELVKDRSTREPAKEAASKIVSGCAKKGMVILSAGLHGNVIRLHPSMLMGKETLEKALDILDESIGETPVA